MWEYYTESMDVNNSEQECNWDFLLKDTISWVKEEVEELFRSENTFWDEQIEQMI